ncbi:MAG: hypothetical protein ACTSPB_23725 [Candidatus Thorarchaeota archaeon]
MTQTWEFVFPDGSKIYINLAWKYVPYIEELQAWILDNWEIKNEAETLTESLTWEGAIEEIPTWDLEQETRQRHKENLRRFFEVADTFVEGGTKQKHPIGWVLDKVKEHMDGPD